MKKLLISIVCICFFTSGFTVHADNVDLRIYSLDFYQLQLLIADEKCDILNSLEYSKTFNEPMVLNPSSFTEAESMGNKVLMDVSFYQEILKEHNVTTDIDSIYIVNKSLSNTDVLIRCGEAIYWVELEYNLIKNDIGDYEFVILNIDFGTKDDFDSKYSLDEGKVQVCNQVSVENSFYLYNKEALLPLRAMVESIGATVYWSPVDGSITITTKEAQYQCYTIDEKHIGMRNSTNAEANPIMLGLMSELGDCYMINDRTYLSEKTAMMVMYELGYKLNIDKEKLTCLIEKIKDDSDMTNTFMQIIRE